MTERTTVQSMLGATVAISASLPATYNAAGYGATGMTYTTVGQVENFGNHGVKANVLTFTPVATGVINKLKGSKDYGQKAFVLGCLPSDSGQDLLRTASESTAHYSVKITYPLGEGEATGEIHYLDVLVSSFENQDGDVQNVRRVATTLEVCRAPVIVDAT